MARAPRKRRTTTKKTASTVEFVESVDKPDTVKDEETPKKKPSTVEFVERVPSTSVPATKTTSKPAYSYERFVERMRHHGLKVGTSIDSMKTKVALKAFQKFNGLKITAELDKETSDKLGL